MEKFLSGTVYYFGTKKQNELLEKMIESLPKGTLSDNMAVRASLISKYTAEIIPMGEGILTVTAPSAGATCREDYVDFEFSNHFYRVYHREKEIEPPFLRA